MIFGNFSTPQRKYYPPSDIESEYETDSIANETSFNQASPVPATNESKKLHKLLEVYKVKYNQLKDAYIEVDAEKEKIKVLFFTSEFIN
jgi:hypothetical protein